MSFRKILFWIHLIVGCVMGLVVLMMSFTGVLLTYERQMIAWAERGYHSAPPSPDAQRLPLAGLLAKVADGGEPPSAVTWEADPTAPVAVSWGRSKTLYVNAYNGNVVGAGEQGVRNFFRLVTSWHRWFAVEGEARLLEGRDRGVEPGLPVPDRRRYVLVARFAEEMEPAERSSDLLVPGRARGQGTGLQRWHNVFGIWCAVSRWSSS